MSAGDGAGSVGGAASGVGDDSWCTIGSDPGVFTEMISSFGVKNVQMEELYAMDEDSLKALEPVYGFVFLFKWVKEEDNRAIDKEANIFFASQVINNACATQAILSILLNSEGIDVGPELAKFREFTAHFPPELKGLSIGNSPLIRKVHNSFARPEPVQLEEVTATKDDDVYHFISYVPVKGTLYELDGLKPGPINLGKCTSEDWISKLYPVLLKRIQRYSETEIRFNLMAIVKDRISVYQDQIDELQATILSLGGSIDEDESSEGPTSMDTSENEEHKSSEDQISSLKQKISQLQFNIKNEQEKREEWKMENTRRRHNYVPFMMKLLTAMANRRHLQPLAEKAKAKASEAAKETSKSK